MGRWGPVTWSHSPVRDSLDLPGRWKPVVPAGSPTGQSSSRAAAGRQVSIPLHTPQPVSAQLMWRPPPPPALPARSICRRPLLRAESPALPGGTRQLSRVPRGPPTSWQFVVVCRVFLSCKPGSPVAAVGLRRWGNSPRPQGFVDCNN